MKLSILDSLENTSNKKRALGLFALLFLFFFMENLDMISSKSTKTVFEKIAITNNANLKNKNNIKNLQTLGVEDQEITINLLNNETTYIGSAKGKLKLKQNQNKVKNKNYYAGVLNVLFNETLVKNLNEQKKNSTLLIKSNDSHLHDFFEYFPNFGKFLRPHEIEIDLRYIWKCNYTIREDSNTIATVLDMISKESATQHGFKVEFRVSSEKSKYQVLRDYFDNVMKVCNTTQTSAKDLKKELHRLIVKTMNIKKEMELAVDQKKKLEIANANKKEQGPIKSEGNIADKIALKTIRDDKNLNSMILEANSVFNNPFLANSTNSNSISSVLSQVGKDQLGNIGNNLVNNLVTLPIHTNAKPYNKMMISNNKIIGTIQANQRVEGEQTNTVNNQYRIGDAQQVYVNVPLTKFLEINSSKTRDIPTIPSLPSPKSLSDITGSPAVNSIPGISASSPPTSSISTPVLAASPVNTPSVDSVSKSVYTPPGTSISSLPPNKNISNTPNPINTNLAAKAPGAAAPQAPAAPAAPTAPVVSAAPKDQKSDKIDIDDDTLIKITNPIGNVHYHRNNTIVQNKEDKRELKPEELTDPKIKQKYDKTEGELTKDKEKLKGLEDRKKTITNNIDELYKKIQSEMQSKDILIPKANMDQTKMKKAEEVIDQTKKQILVIEQQSMEFIAKKNVLNDVHQNKKNEADQLEKDFQAEKGVMNELNEKKKNITETISNFNSQSELATKQLKANEDKKNTLQKETEKAQLTLQQLQKEIEEKSNDINSAQKNFENLEKKINKLQNDIKVFEENQKQAIKKQDDLTKKIDTVESEKLKKQSYQALSKLTDLEKPLAEAKKGIMVMIDTSALNIVENSYNIAIDKDNNDLTAFERELTKIPNYIWSPSK